MDLLVYLGGGAAALLALGAAVRGGWRVLRRIVFIAEAVEELVPNGGGSMKDKVTQTAGDVAEIKAAFAEHLNNHP